MSRKILQENPRQNPPKSARQKSPTRFCRGAGPRDRLLVCVHDGCLKSSDLTSLRTSQTQTVFTNRETIQKRGSSTWLHISESPMGRPSHLMPISSTLQLQGQEVQSTRSAPELVLLADIAFWSSGQVFKIVFVSQFGACVPKGRAAMKTLRK